MSEESSIPQTILRGLSDRTNEKRHASALQLHQVAKSCMEKNDLDRVLAMINQLSQEYVRSSNVSRRKGGLKGIA